MRTFFVFASTTRFCADSRNQVTWPERIWSDSACEAEWRSSKMRRWPRLPVMVPPVDVANREPILLVANSVFVSCLGSISQRSLPLSSLRQCFL